jgi:S1-C subfamily serine protease
MATSQDHDAYRPFPTEGHPGPPPFVSKPAPRPAVEPAAAELFGRPAGVIGAFADQPVGAIRQWAAAPPTPEALETAFARPSRSDERLQRPPGRNGARPSAGLAGEDDFWTQGAARDPWRDPWAAAVLGDPAVGQRDVNAGSVAAVAGRVLPAVVSLEFRVGDQGGFGSGVVIDGHGYLLTNNHVVAPAADIPHATLEAVFSDGTRLPARIVGRDPKTDLAVVKVEVANATVAQLGRSSTLKSGDPVIAIGSPLGLAGTVTSGIVSAVNRPVRLEADGGNGNAVIDAIQTDAAINPGNSGGALVDGAGAVVGINTAIRTLGAVEGGGSIGLGFAIPIDTARTIAQELIRTGHYQHADLGVNAASVTDGKSDGARVQNVQQGSAAAEAGILENDVITKVGNRIVGTADALTVAVRERGIGERVPISLVRDGRPLVVTVTLKSD